RSTSARSARFADAAGARAADRRAGAGAPAGRGPGGWADHPGAVIVRLLRPESTPASRATSTPASGTTSNPRRNDVASATRPTTGGEARHPSRISQDTTVSPVPGRRPGTSFAADMAAGTRVATPDPGSAKPAIVPGPVGSARRVPIPTVTITPPARATARCP